MATNREFSDSIKLEVIKNNLKKNNGSICCEICRTKLSSIDECHFDHIYPFAKGGRSTLENCQILCSDCNLRKNDKVLQDFMLEEQAKLFLSGGSFSNTAIEKKAIIQNTTETTYKKDKPHKLQKEEFDKVIKEFIDKKGDIHKVDFTRAYNQLPSITYVREYYGDLGSLKKAFGIEDLSSNWNRETIRQALLGFVSVHGDVSEKDLKKSNGIPSYPCIMKHYSEYKSFSSFKHDILGINKVYKVWTKEDAITSGIAFVKEHGSLNEKDLKAINGLPTSKVIYTHFGTLANYQKQIGAPVMGKNEFITKDELKSAVDMFFGDKERSVLSRKVFFDDFPYSLSVVVRRYGSFSNFCSENGITLINTKRAAWTKKEVDDTIHEWVFSGNDMPKGSELSLFGLPSMSAIMKFYENWREPFIIYQRIYDEANRNKK